MNSVRIVRTYLRSQESCSFYSSLRITSLFIVGSLLFQLLTHSKKKKKNSPSPCCPATWWLHRSVRTRGSLLTTPETTETGRQINQQTVQPNREKVSLRLAKPKKCKKPPQSSLFLISFLFVLSCSFSFFSRRWRRPRLTRMLSKEDLLVMS